MITGWKAIFLVLMRSNSKFVVWLLAGHVLQHQRPCVDLKISHQCISLDPLPRAGQVFFVRFIGTDPNAPHYHRNHLCHYILHFSNFFRKILIFLNNFSSFFLTRPFSGIATSIIWQLFSLLSTISKSGLLALSSWSVRVLKSHKKL